MAISPFTAAINQLADERGLPRDVIHDTINTAVAAAYRKEYGHSDQVMRAEFDEETGKFLVWQIWDVVEEVENEQNQKLEADAKKIKKSAKVGETVEIELEPHSDFGRIAAQTAKQVIDQKIREAEKETIIAEYRKKVGSLVNGIVLRADPYKLTVGIGKTEAICPKDEQIKGEMLQLSAKKLFLIKEIYEDAETGRKEIIISRRDPGFIKELFAREVPEVGNNAVTIERIARSSGERTKVAVFSSQPGVDPVGSCIGQKGSRIQSILNELPKEEKVDVIAFSKSLNQLIINALSPADKAKVVSIENGFAVVSVPEDQLALAIGSGGENVKLAGEIAGLEIKVVSENSSTSKVKGESVELPNEA
jgi:N utilization substance protein A